MWATVRRAPTPRAQTSVPAAIDSVIITTSSIRPPLAADQATRAWPSPASSARPYLPRSLPPIAESGYPGYNMIDCNGLFAANGTPLELIARMQGGLRRRRSGIPRCGSGSMPPAPCWSPTRPPLSRPGWKVSRNPARHVDHQTPTSSWGDQRAPAVSEQACRLILWASAAATSLE